MGEITGVGQIHISVEDVDKAAAWYRDVLGLTFLFRVEGAPMAFLDSGGVRLYLGRPEDERFRSRPIIYYRVPAIDAAYDAIAARSGVFSDTPHVVHRDQAHELWMCFLTDPDGNPVALMEERPIA